MKISDKKLVKEIKNQHFSNITHHPAQKYINRIWQKIDRDCYFNISDMPAMYNQHENIVVLDVDNTHNAPLNYLRNRVYYSDYVWQKSIESKLKKEMQVMQAIEEAKDIATKIKEINLKINNCPKDKN